MINTDVVIIGGGSVGLTAALALAQKDFKVTVIDQASGVQPLEQPQSRVSAISLASQQVLTQLDAWQHMDLSRCLAYDTMHVWEKESFADITFDANDLNAQQSVGHLGHIIENHNIRNGLLKAAQQQDNITLLLETGVTSIHNDDEQVLLTLNNGQPVIAKLCIAADGANSWVKQQLRIPTTFSDYDHHAIVANIKTTEPHGQCARQVFLPNGPLALLPMYHSSSKTASVTSKREPGSICSIVWSTEPQHAEQLMAMSDSDFNKALTAASDSVLGPLELTTDRIKFPLTMRYAQTWLEQRVLFMGDAAHTIHPLAGLGMNLGLMDAASIVDCIDLTDLQNPAKLQKGLRHFERWRKAEAQTYIVAMAGLKNLFDGNHPIKKLIRGVGLKLTDKAGPIKRRITEQAVGMQGELPTLAKPVDPLR